MTSMLVFVIYLIMTYQADACMPMVPPDEMEFTSTMESISTPVGNKCGQCIIEEIAPETTPEDTVFGPVEQDPVDGCLRTQVICERHDPQVCNTVLLYATTPMGRVPIADLTGNAFVFATLSCDEDGTYSYNDVKQIEQLTCYYDGCYIPNLDNP